MRNILALVVLCQLCLASLSFASVPSDDSSSVPPDSGHNVTVHRTDSGQPVTIDDTDTGVTVSIDGSQRPGATAADDPAAVPHFTNADLPGGGVKKDAVLPGADVVKKDAGLPGTGGAKESGTVDIGRLLERAIAEHLIEGGIAVVGDHNGILSTTARGRLNLAADAPPIGERTIFDLASLTKVIATAPAVMKLLDQGRLSLSDPISRWFPEFVEPGREEITVLHLLTHTSGLDDVGIGSEQPMESAVRKAAAQKNHSRPGTHFHYADINFILLGELVHRVSGEPLNQFCQEQIYAPLGASETMFLPPRELTREIAPTSGASCGIVQDPNARRLGGVAGHAGLFSSAYDLSRFARMMLGGGMLEDKRILSEQIVTQMTSPYVSNNGAVQRGLGWDMNSPFSAPKGSLFSRSSFGHTGYSGSSIWIDPQQDRFVILLTNRTNYHDTHTFNQLRRNVSTVAAADFKQGGETPGSSAELARINADLLREVTRAVQAAPRLKLASYGGKHQRLGRRACKTDRHFAHGSRRVTRSAESRRGNRVARVAGLSRGSHQSKASGKKTASRKKRGQGRRA